MKVVGTMCAFSKYSSPNLFLLDFTFVPVRITEFYLGLGSHVYIPGIAWNLHLTLVHKSFRLNQHSLLYMHCVQSNKLLLQVMKEVERGSF